jgi:hypothetical protein
MEIIPDKRKLVGLVDQAGDGRICLPNFQRDFVWKRDEVADLIRSVLRGYFIGSLLLLRSDPQHPPFAPMPIRGAKPTKTTLAPELLILDGQQRLTSTLYALTAPELGLRNSKAPRRFFIDLDALITDIDSDDIVFDRRPNDARRDGLDAPAGQWAQHKLPCTALLHPKTYMAWRDGLDDWLRDTSSDDHKRFRDEWRDPWTAAVNGFQSFEVPVVELPLVTEGDEDAIGRVCAIFEKLNSTGQALSVYDLLTARLYRSGINLHALWDESCNEHKLLNEWSGGKADNDNFGVLVLRTLALLRDLEPKTKTLINLDPKNFEEDWRRAARAFNHAIEIMMNTSAEGFGVFAQKWLPGNGLIPVLAALRAVIDDHNLGAKPRSDLRRWYWSSVFLERYSSTVETKSRRDYMEFVNHWLKDGPAPSVFADAQARIGASGYSVRDSASHASAVYSGIFCLLALGGARDWRASESIALHQLDDHHIFPRAVLLRNGYKIKSDKKTINSIVNRTLISTKTNGKISDTVPGAYLLDPGVFEDDPATLLASHFVDGDALAAMKRAVADADPATMRGLYDEFRNARERRIIEAIRAVCGIDIVTPEAPEEFDDEPDYDEEDDEGV